MKHTEGPWKTTQTYSHIYRDEENGLCGVICKMPDASYPLQWIVEPASLENSANARLIAAAPEMLAALRAIVARINGVWDDPDLVRLGGLSEFHDRDIERIAQVAIAKAHGHE